MKKNKLIIIIAILLVLGLFSVTISLKNFFYTTKYYDNPIQAYNSGGTYDTIYGDIKATRNLGFVNLDEENGLFIGEISKTLFVVVEMKLKEDKYASQGTVIIYDLEEPSDGMNKNKTTTKQGFFEWAILYSQSEIDPIAKNVSVTPLSHSSGQIIYLVVYDN